MMSELSSEQTPTGLEIAIVGMAGRFPGADSIEAFWKNLSQSVESIAQLSEAELLKQGLESSQIREDSYVKAGGVLEGIEQFDAGFFGFSPREADLLDPQQRLFLECAWQALETAGYDTENEPMSIGVYGGTGMNGYLFNLYQNRQIRQSASPYELFIASDKDFLTTRVSYKLNLTGPSVDLQTACSTSLVAVHLACQSLLSGECDMALAGGVAISKQVGYRYQAGGIYSPDGHCRAFDAAAQGTVGGNGVGVVVLKRLQEALADGDRIDAVIKGSAINNDGSFKVSYTAPRIDTQAAVIHSAQAIAEVHPDSIDYIEAHGTGTALGDPIEVAALTQAFRQQTQRSGFCALGSVKSNIGHLDAAAGIASLIKAVLALKHRQIPATLHIQAPNPQIDWKNSPFYLAAEPIDWPRTDTPRRAGVSSFGIGGTNAHVVLEESTQEFPQPSHGSCNHPENGYILPLSAKSPAALSRARKNLANHLRHREGQRQDGQHPEELNLADIAHTLQRGRRGFEHRCAVVCQTTAEAIALLSCDRPEDASSSQNISSHQPSTVLPPNSTAVQFSFAQPAGHRSVAFLFSGQGSQHRAMAQQLYQQIPGFRQTLDRCAELLQGQFDLLAALQSDLQTTAAAQPALFAVEYALAKLWISWGIQPEALLGHSLGEYVAACLAGVFSLESALRLVVERGRLMQQMQAGAMLSVGLSAEKLASGPLERLKSQLKADANTSVDIPEIAVINGPDLCVVSGSEAAIAQLQTLLEQGDVSCRRLQTDHGFHSAAMEPMLEPFRAWVDQIPLAPPTIPILSNLTGTWLSDAEATDSSYWVQHLRQPVQFAQGLQHLGEPIAAEADAEADAEPDVGADRLPSQPQNPGVSHRILLEVGPGKALYSLAKAILKSQAVLHSLPHPQDDQPELLVLQKAIAQLWTWGAPLRWPSIVTDLSSGQRLRRVPLPTYPFERQRHWIEPDLPDELAAFVNRTQGAGQPTPAADVSGDLLEPQAPDSWFYVPTWQRSHSFASRESAIAQQNTWLLLIDDWGLGRALAQRLEQAGQHVFIVVSAQQFDSVGYRQFSLNPDHPQDYRTLLEELRLREMLPQYVVHLWDLEGEREFERSQTRGFLSLLYLAQAWTSQSLSQTTRFSILSDRQFSVLGSEAIRPAAATLQGISQVLGQEYAELACHQIDLDLSELAQNRSELDSANSQSVENSDLHPAIETLSQNIWTSLVSEQPDAIVAFRGRHCWQPAYRPLVLSESEPLPEQASIRRQPGAHAISPRLKPQGCYLLTGDLAQGLGWIVAQQLVEQWQARLVVVADANSIAEIEAQWSKLDMHPVEMLGFEISEAGAGDLLAEAIAAAEQRFGGVDGVFFSAPTTNEKAAAPIALLEDHHWQYNLSTKVQPLQRLAAAIQDKAIGFCCVQSSLSSVLGGLGLAAYTAANSFVDRFVEQQNQREADRISRPDKTQTTWLSLNWDACLPEDAEPVEGFGAAIAAYALTPSEVWRATERLLSQPDLGRSLSQVVVSKVALSDRIPRPDPRSTAVLPQARAAEPLTPGSFAGHPRPALTQAYVAPATETEEAIAHLWQELLGLEPVGVHDSFFDLGGHSLLAIQAISRLRDIFQVELSMRNLLFETPTVASIAAEIDKALRPPEELDVMAELLAEVQGLSDEMLQQQLTAQAAQEGS